MDIRKSKPILDCGHRRDKHAGRGRDVCGGLGVACARDTRREGLLDSHEGRVSWVKTLKRACAL
eukprot:1372606-Amorphochlora_amoeboformis.AAC.2